MTIYVHFRTPRPAVRLFNVASVHDHGSAAVQVKMTFTDDQPIFTDVSHVAVQIDREAK